MKLTEIKCVPCKEGTPPLSHEEIEEFQKNLIIKWEVVADTKIFKKFTLKDFDQALEFINKVGAIAKEEDHHPNIHMYYNIVEIELWTHKIGGLSQNDFIIAAKIDEIQI